MNEQHEDLTARPAKRTWTAPTVERIAATGTAAGGGCLPDGFTNNVNDDSVS